MRLSKRKRYSLMLFSLGIAIVLWAAKGHAEGFNPNKSEYPLLELDEVSVEYKSFLEGARVPLTYPESPTSALNTRINMSILKYGFFRNDIYTHSVGSQFRTVSWAYSLGFTLYNRLDLYFAHQSAHVLDREIGLPMSYPVENALAFRLYIYRKEQ